jgi:predicted transposase/invertase (TIGR01784 family)
MEQGLEKGRDEGIQIGVVQAKTDLIIKLHKSGMSAQEIANLTELSESEIQRLINPQ